MPPGQWLIWLAFLASLAACVGFGLAFRAVVRAPGGVAAAEPDSGAFAARWRAVGRVLQILSLVGMVAAAAELMRLLLAHEFRFSYVSRYSSRDLPLHYLISTFWAGQEGTFLLWATWTGCLALVVSRTARRLESGVMFFLMLVQSLLLLILLRLSPFALNPSTPADGAGLNPLLQDPWMVIHPPMLFVGFASAAVPAAFALQALVRGDTDHWARGARPWAAFTVLLLGTPICLGGYWAYRVLGWGGYWGWDPVENGSLVPWLFSVALLHGLVVQERRGLMKRLNLVLGISGFALVLYATFLTRSGVLGDFSVHSFLDLGINGYLVAFLVGYILLAFGLYAWRVRAIVEPEFRPGVLSREYGMYLGALSVVAFALLVLLGTSSPLFTRLGGTPANVAISYYEAISVPFGILLCLGLAVVPRLLWGRNRGAGLGRSLVAPALLGALSGLLLVFVGVRQVHHLALVTAAAFAFFVNFEIVVRRAMRSPLTSGGHLVHAGVATMIVGIITSAVYSRSEPVLLPLGQPVTALGYRLVWSGVRAIDAGRKEAYDIQVTPEGGTAFTASPVMFFSEYSRGVMRRPAIRRFIAGDLYLSPQGVDRDRILDSMETHEVTLAPGETAAVGAHTLRFVGPQPRTMSELKLEIAALLEVTTGGRTETVAPVVATTGAGSSYQEARLFDGTKILLRRFDPRGKRALFYLRTPDSADYDRPTEALHLDLAVKPWINVLWLGTFMGIGGLILTVIQRTRRSGRGSPESHDGGAHEMTAAR